MLSKWYCMVGQIGLDMSVFIISSIWTRSPTLQSKQWQSLHHDLQMTEDNQCYTSPDLRELLANYLADAKNTINKISVKLCPLWHVSQFQLRKQSG